MKIVPDDGPLDRLEEEERDPFQGEDEEERYCTALLSFWRDEDGAVCCARSVRQTFYRPPARLWAGGRGLTLYPVAGMSWLRRRGSARGAGEASALIPNQIETNKMLARRLMNARMTAFSRLVYNADKVLNKEALDQVGAAIKVRDMQANHVTDVVSYLGAAPMSPDARLLAEELVRQTRELAGAGDAVLGQVNPEKATGAAIIAARDQAALPLNQQIADFRQFIEDIAAIWFELWAVYYPQELTQGPDPLTWEELRRLRVEIRIDAAPNSPYSRFAQEQTLENLFQRGVITFEEYVSALDENAAAPKRKLEAILRARSAGTGGDQAPVLQEGGSWFPPFFRGNLGEFFAGGAKPPLPRKFLLILRENGDILRKTARERRAGKKEAAGGTAQRAGGGLLLFRFRSRRARPLQDRKSTRLNSSHSS